MLSFCNDRSIQKSLLHNNHNEVGYEYVSPVRPTPALRNEGRCAGPVSLLWQPEPETLPGAQRGRVVDDHQMPELPVPCPARALVAALVYPASSLPSSPSQPP